MKIITETKNDPKAIMYVSGDQGVFYRYLSNYPSCSEELDSNYEIHYEEDQTEVIEVFSKTLLQETTDDDSDSSILRPMLNMKKHVIEEQN
jgi:hypothetical protein